MHPPTRIQRLKRILYLLPIPLLWVWMDRPWINNAPDLLAPFENIAMDWRFQFRGEIAAPIKVFYVDLDSFALSLIGERPWDRAFFADAASICFELGKAKAVGFDFIFSKAAKASQLVSADKSASSDYALGRVVRLYPTKIVLGANYTDLRMEHMFDPSEGRGRYGGFPFIRNGGYDAKTNPYPETPTFPIIGATWGRLGLVATDPQRDAGDVSRWVPLFAEFEGQADSMNILIGERDWLHLPAQSIRIEGDFLVLKDRHGNTLDTLPKETKRTFYNMAVELALVYYGLDDSAIERTPDYLKIISADDKVLINIPLTDQQDMQVNWFSRWHNDELNPRCSIASLYDKVGDYYQGTAQEREAARAFFEKMNDAIVLIGAVDESLKDLAPTPFDAQPVPKVGIYGNVIKTIFSGLYIHTTAYWVNIAITLVLTWVLATLGLYTGRHGLLMKSVVVALFVGYILMVFVGFSLYEIVLPLVAPVGSAVTTAFFGLIVRLVQEEQQKNRVKDLFGAYVSPELVDRMVEMQEQPKLGGAEEMISAFFSDVQHFTALAEQMTPSKIVDLMNEYLSAMTEILQQEGAALDKYIGDAIVAMFGAPIVMPDHAYRACRAAHLIQLRQAELRAKWLEESNKWPEDVSYMLTRVGVSTGLATVGNMGSSVRFNYTMMGDTVNLAARCESAAKIYGVYTMVTEDTKSEAEKTSDECVFRMLDRILVKGRTHSVAVYEVAGFKEDATAELYDCIDYYQKALHCYFEQDWLGGLRWLDKSMLLEPLQPGAMPSIYTNPSLVLKERCSYFLKHGVETNWNGVFVMQDK